ncbi:MAG: winged helix-turn-helix domain-containing protein [Candidatus Odinarchaeum yellowstonii]|uniref:Winged helix-turn-helix domain-containing protein n=1 Tax=Odinarchaeota yellowstonii (strain LCB_4) TaxID=1841599 RepID=A0AAF0D3B3_ODILC|nr:MAG: winged helix-turn-helix domain-containing protein [Candidatus Odinarchaeum yellowstonii]
MNESGDIIVNKIIELLKKAGRPLTTKQIENEINKLGLKCPDTPARYLNQLRLKGVIKGELSLREKSWIWFI